MSSSGRRNSKVVTAGKRRYIDVPSTRAADLHGYCVLRRAVVSPRTVLDGVDCIELTAARRPRPFRPSSTKWS